VIDIENYLAQLVWELEKKNVLNVIEKLKSSRQETFLNQ